MSGIFNFLKEILMLKESDSVKIGLSQIREKKITATRSKRTVSVKPDDVKLSDLMRRAS